MTERTNEDVSARCAIGPSAASVLGERERAYPVVFQVVIDAVDTLELAEFYRHLLGLEHRQMGRCRSGSCSSAMAGGC